MASNAETVTTCPRCYGCGARHVTVYGHGGKHKSESEAECWLCVGKGSIAGMVADQWLAERRPLDPPPAAEGVNARFAAERTKRSKKGA